MTAHRVIGHTARPPLAASKATGTGRFPPDYPDEALHAALLLSDVPHAAITRLHLDEARRSPGVASVLGRTDLGMDDTVRHVGDVIAAVTAETPELARAALTTIDVAYRRLPVLVDAGDALDSTSTPDPLGSGVEPRPPDRPRTGRRRRRSRRGRRRARGHLPHRSTDPLQPQPSIMHRGRRGWRRGHVLGRCAPLRPA